MKKNLLFLFLISSFFVFSQEQDAWVYFKNKPDANVFLANPLSMLTQRSLDRRTNQNISLDIKDVPIHQPYYDQIASSTGIVIKAKSKWLNCVHVRGTQSDINALISLESVDRVDFADQSINGSRGIAVIRPLNPVNKVLETQTNFSYGNSANQIEMLNGHLLHQQNFTGSGKIIAVLDAGFPGVDTAQPFQRLFDNNLILGGYNYVDRISNVYTQNSHGTLVLSIMGGFVDGQLVGTAPDASYYLYITEDADTENPIEESNWVEAAEEADRVGVDIITSSLGYFGYDNPAYSHTYEDMIGDKAFISRGANIAFSRGIICVASAGNNAQTFEPHVGLPAEALNVLAIGAVKNDETYASFSSIGPSFDGRIKPDVAAQGQSTTIATPSGNLSGNGNGTSFSGPIMAGMIASFWQSVPTLTNQQVVDFVKQSADRFSNPNAQFGYGIPDFQAALNNVLGIQNNTKSNFLLSPNPANSIINVSFPNELKEAKISFFNAVGQIILEKNISEQYNVLNIENLNSGIYFYKIQNVFFSQSGKIIKN